MREELFFFLIEKAKKGGRKEEPKSETKEECQNVVQKKRSSFGKVARAGCLLVVLLEAAVLGRKETFDLEKAATRRTRIPETEGKCVYCC